MTKKYSSYKEHQLITENWRDFLAEEEGPEHSLGKWAKMFPRAAKALEALGAKIEDITKAIDDAQPEVGSPEAELRRQMQASGLGQAGSGDVSDITYMQEEEEK